MCPTPLPPSLPRMVTDRVIPGIPNRHVGGDVQLPTNSGGPSKMSEEFGEIFASFNSKNRVWLKALRRAGLNSEHTYVYTQANSTCIIINWDRI